MAIQFKKILITLFLLALAGISPNLFPAAQAGLASFPSLVKQFLLPSAGMILILVIVVRVLRYNDLSRLAINGIAAGIISTVVLEIFRITGFRIGWLPGDLPRLMGVIMLNQFASGPDIWSDLAGWAYHFWNGAMFGLIFSLLLGQSKLWQGLLYGLLIGAAFMLSPVVKSLGIGVFGIDFKEGYQFPLTVTLAHLAFGLALSFLMIRFNKGIPNIRLRSKDRYIKVNQIPVLSNSYEV